MKPKFNIGDTVYNTVECQGSYEPSICKPFTRLCVDGVRRSGDTFVYVCDYDGYELKESELLSPKEYAERILSN